jgi:hypothetical protein
MNNSHRPKDAIDSLVREQLRKTKHDGIAAYAVEMAGTSSDLDSDLEAAGIEHLLKAGKAGK